MTRYHLTYKRILCNVLLTSENNWEEREIVYEIYEKSIASIILYILAIDNNIPEG